MRPEDIDQLFRESADSAQFEFDPKEWQKTKSLLSKKKKRRWLPIFFFSLGLGSVIAIILISAPKYSQKNNLQTPSNLVVSTEAQNKTTTTHQNREIQTIPKAQQNIQNNEQSTSTTPNVKEARNILTRSTFLTPKHEQIKGLDSRVIVASEKAQLTAASPKIALLKPIIKWQSRIDHPDIIRIKNETIYKEWELGLSLSTAFQILEGGSNGLGISPGIVIRKNFKRGIYIELAPKLSWTSGFDHITKREIQTIFGLESHDKIYGFQLRQLVQLELPMRIGINIKKWRIGLGPNISFLIQGMGDLVELSSPDDDFAIVRSLSNGRFDKRKGLDYYLGSSINLHYRLSRLSELGIEGSRTSDQFFTDDFEPLMNKGNWLINLTYNYYLD